MIPFFAKLFGEKRMREFADTVNGSIYRIVATSLLATSFMMAAMLVLKCQRPWKSSLTRLMV